MLDSAPILVIVEDRHAERELRRALDAARASGHTATVLTSDAPLAMRLRREGLDARLTIDGLTPDTLVERDRVALAGIAAALGTSDTAGIEACLEYTLIPTFMRTVRSITAIDDVMSRPGPFGPGGAGHGSIARVVLVGGGPLVDAARLVAHRRGIAIEEHGDPLQRIGQTFARLVAGRATRWVNTEFRALLLEPGFILLLFLKGLWSRIAGPPSPPARPRALIVVGDRFTADVVERLRGDPRTIILAGATQPGRDLFRNASGLVPIEAFTELLDPFRGIAGLLDAIGQVQRLWNDRAHAQRFTAGGVPYWNLVRRTVCVHHIVWVPLLQQLQSLVERIALAYPDARLLTSTDVTAYNRVLIETARRRNIRSTGIQHGIPGEPNGHSKVRVDTLAVWGQETERWYRDRDRQNATFVVTGNPRFDPLALRSPKPKAKSLFTVAVCTGFVSDFSVGASELENLLMLDAVLAWAKQWDDARVIHKMHPGEEAEYYAAAATALGWDPLRLTTIREPILYDVLEKSNVLVAAYSTTVLEALALGTPAIVFDAIVQRKLLPLGRVPGITIAFSIDDLRQQLEACRTGTPVDPKALRSSPELRAYISELDGGATARVAALVEPSG